MIINIKTVLKIESALSLKLFRTHSGNLFALNYIAKNYYEIGLNEGRKTVLYDEDTKEAYPLMNGLEVLGISSQRKLYSLKDDTERNSRLYSSLFIYDIINNEYKKSISTDLFFSYGDSSLLENDIGKLYIAFYGSDERGDEGLLVIDLKGDQVIKKININGKPSRLVIDSARNKLFAIVFDFNHGSMLTTINTINDERLDSFALNFHPVNAILRNEYLLLLEFLKGVHIFDTEQKSIIETKSIPEIVLIEPTSDQRYFLLLLQSTKPFCVNDRLALYDIQTNRIITEHQVSNGMHLKTFEDGRMFFTEMKDNELLINEIKII